MAVDEATWRKGAADRRGAQRSTVRLSVVLHARGNRLLPARIHDASCEGGFIETEAEEIFGERLLRVGFVFEERLWIIHARVSRTSSKGVGVSFKESCREAQHAFAQLLASRAPPRAAGTLVS